jgi:hypothetical protein
MPCHAMPRWRTGAAASARPRLRRQPRRVPGKRRNDQVAFVFRSLCRRTRRSPAVNHLCINRSSRTRLTSIPASLGKFWNRSDSAMRLRRSPSAIPARKIADGHGRRVECPLQRGGLAWFLCGGASYAGRRVWPAPFIFHLSNLLEKVPLNRSKSVKIGQNGWQNRCRGLEMRVGFAHGVGIGHPHRSGGRARARDADGQ